jgi:hypothetical protein
MPKQDKARQGTRQDENRAPSLQLKRNFLIDFHIQIHAQLTHYHARMTNVG